MKQLFTIGYEGAALDDFMRILKAAKVDVLLDVRELAMSRRKGFSKTALGGALTDAGIHYRHEKQPGHPNRSGIGCARTVTIRASSATSTDT